MKIARYVPIGMLGLFVVTIRASADPTAPDPVDNPYTQYDPDGIPLAVTHPQPQRLSQDELDAIHKQQEQAALDKNWLLRNYEKQLQARAANSPEDQSANLYYQLSSNKDLAKLAGLPALDSDSQDGATALPNGRAPFRPGPGDLRADASSAATSGFPSHGNLFKPLITPLSAPEPRACTIFTPPCPSRWLRRSPAAFPKRLLRPRQIYPRIPRTSKPRAWSPPKKIR